MRLYRFIIPLLAIISLLFSSTEPAISAVQKMDARVAASYGKLPLSFVENKGQMDKRARFVIRGPRASAYFRNDGVTFDLWDASKKDRLNKKDMLSKAELGKLTKPEKRKHAVLKLTFKGANSKCRVDGMDTLPGKVNYMKGNDKSKWHTDIPTYKSVIYKDVWQGIDIMYRGDRRQLKYDIRMNPGAEIRNVQLRYDGAQKMWLDKKGTLHIKTAVTEFVEKVPGIYQEKDGKQISVTGGYRLLDKKTVGFTVKDVDPSLPMVIDPASDLVYSTLLGGSGGDSIYSVAVDVSGFIYLTGSTQSSDFPTTFGAFYEPGSGADLFIAKIDPLVSKLEYSTILGGDGFDRGIEIVVDSSSCAYVTGYTQSIDFPTTPDAFDTSYGGGFFDAFVIKLNQSGSELDYTTFLGGSQIDIGWGITVDSSCCTYVTGETSSSDFPTTSGAFDQSLGGVEDGFITKLDPSGTAIVYSTFLGGSSGDMAYAIAVDTSGCAYVAGFASTCNDFPTTPGAYNTTLNGGAYILKLNSSGSGLGYSTFIGDISAVSGCEGIAVDSSGCTYVTGETPSRYFPTTPGAFSRSFGGGHSDAFVFKLNSTGSMLEYSTSLLSKII
ncbi:MAG: DUF7948 domain-containing protein [Armatimonadota bacterium]